ncbi:MAG: molybdopterin cofactor-binding domain-containing protein [Imperialibacter sp.]|uniref:xanthine dehydrogenase family protein molybdopterin-binding subunit n=1 Tax=Imperialibacter sp. TaxID=2038411 RepID=UPI003A889BDC
MTLIKTSYNRRSFLKVSAAGSGGLVIGFNWLVSCSPSAETAIKGAPKEWFNVNAYLKIGENGLVTIMSPNPEVGQNVKTSMPMIVAEELDVAWKDVVVEQAPLDTEKFVRQVAGGSQSLRSSWKGLRMAGATARKMLMEAAAKQWQVDASTLTTSEGVIKNAKGDTLTYGQIASAAASVTVPEEVELKDPSAFKIIGTDTKNVDIEKIITGKPQYGMDLKKEGMKVAVVLRPPSFGAKLKSFDDSETRKVTGVSDVIQFGNKVAVLGNTTWAAMKGKKALKAEWEEDTPAESTEYHDKQMMALLNTKNGEPRRNDGDVDAAFKTADKVIEKTFEGPFLPHNPMEPMNFYGHVTASKVDLIGPIQTPERTRRQVAELLGRPETEIFIDMTRMGGGFGRRLYGDFVLEVAEISKLSNTPIKLVYTREDDMTAGIYRPASKYKFKAGVKDGKLVAYHLVGTGINGNGWTRENWFPAGSIPNYRVESYGLDSNITTGAWRAPITNFLAYAEQSFIDEVAEEMGVDAVQLRLDLLEKAKSDPVGTVDYEPEKMIGAIKLAAEKANWSATEDGVSKGFSAYYSHNSYVAMVAEVVNKKGQPSTRKVTCAVDCGIVINPIAAKNQIEGGIIDGIGHAMYGDMTFVNGAPQASNFNNYRLIRMGEAPPVIECHFVKNTNDPTGLGEPSLPPAGGALANAMYKATGQRFYKQPFMQQQIKLG